MNKFVTAGLLLLTSALARADFIDYFKDDEGHTKWQYVANFSSSVLIVLLSVAVVILFFSHHRTRKANRALEQIRRQLEQIVSERTAYIKNILDSMPSMLIGLDAEMNVTQWNRSAEAITGVAIGQAIGNNLWQVYPAITIAPEQVSGVLRDNKPTTIKHSQRGQYYFDITIYPLQGQIAAGVVILIDNVTQRTLTENMLIQRDKMSSMGELAATMAHDINMPLQAILRDLQTLESAGAGALDATTMQNLLNDASERGKQAVHIINNLLGFSRSRGNEKQLASIPEILDHALELAQNTLAEPDGLRFQDIRIEKRYEPNLPQLPCYVSELQQVFLSLLRHACHALALARRPDSIPTINLEVMVCYDALWVKIQHNGLGLSEDEQQYLFEPFFNAAKDKNATAENRLSFSYFIIAEHHKGQMAVTSNPDVGTTFHIQLQLH